MQSHKKTRYVLQYAGSLDFTCLQGLREPPGSCKLLTILALGHWHGRGHRFDPDQVHQITQQVRAAPRGDSTSIWEHMGTDGRYCFSPSSASVGSDLDSFILTTADCALRLSSVSACATTSIVIPGFASCTLGQVPTSQSFRLSV